MKVRIIVLLAVVCFAGCALAQNNIVDNASVIINPGATIPVDNASVIINPGATIPACSTMWQNFNVSTTGRVTGLPVTPGLCAFTVTACDSSNPPMCSQPTQITILVPTPVQIIQTSLADGFVGVSYDQTITGVQGGNGGPFNFQNQ